MLVLLLFRSEVTEFFPSIHTQTWSEDKEGSLGVFPCSHTKSSDKNRKEIWKQFRGSTSKKENANQCNTIFSVFVRKLLYKYYNYKTLKYSNSSLALAVWNAWTLTLHGNVLIWGEKFLRFS